MLGQEETMPRKRPRSKQALTFFDGGVAISGGLDPELLARLSAKSDAAESEQDELVATLADLMLSARRSGSAPYTLLLGAGASKASGAQLAGDVVKDVVGGYDLDRFDKYLAARSDEERFARLRGAIEGLAPSPGYEALAKLTKAGFFAVILTTNFDPLLEDALSQEGLTRRDVALLVNGVMEPDFIEEQLACLEPRVKVVKLHGDLFYRKFLFTGEEIREYPESLRRALNGPLNMRGVIAVGHGLVDQNLRACIRKTSQKIWRVNPGPLKPEAEAVLRTRDSLSLCIGGATGAFDSFFQRLASSLLARATTVPVDELRRSIVAVIHPQTGQPLGTGFLLKGAGLVVTDTMVAGGLAGTLTLTGGGRKLSGTWERAKGARPADAYAPRGTVGLMQPFGAGIRQRMELVLEPTALLDYAVFRAEDDLWKERGFALAAQVPPVGTRVTTGIAVGDSMGFKDGVLRRIDVSVPVTGPEGRVQCSGLMETDITIDNGACGSPLLSEDGLCCGMMVAGATNGPSMALPTALLVDRFQAPQKIVVRPKKAKAQRRSRG
jgi:SIR2-like domain